MPNEQLEEWVKNQLSRGRDANQVRNELLRVGWDPNAVDGVFMRTSSGNEKTGENRTHLMLIALIAVVCIASIVILISFLPSLQFGSNAAESGFAFTANMANYGKVCDDLFSGDSCRIAVALYKENETICDEIVESEFQTVCKRTMSEGRLMHQEYIQIDDCDYSIAESMDYCKKSCENSGMRYENGTIRSIRDPIPISSWNGYTKCKDGSGFTMSSCYCF